MNCLGGLAKIILVIFNFIFLLAGLLMLAIGILAIVKTEYIFIILGNTPGMSNISKVFDLGGIISAGAIFMIVLGAVVGAVGFFGCCGAYGEKKGLLIAYVVALTLVLCTQAALIIFVVVSPATLQENIQKLMMKSMDGFTEDVTIENGALKAPNDSISLGWSVLQIEANCCGTYNYTDYSNWSHNVTINGVAYPAKVPVSCCANNENIQLSSKTYNISVFTNLTECLNGNYVFVNQKNCYDSILDVIKESIKIVIGIAAGIIGLQLVLIILASVLCCRQNPDEKKQEGGEESITCLNSIFNFLSCLVC